ncbi:division/cell wall cluster transcriptional repressor MraZ [Candidatus Woesearchaeota archaeon]|nr:division/cell wall cluster transcriptional repressor MraZ [Candidatus Woesearchaeota archaeon]
MISGKLILPVDKKGRIHVPQELREEIGITDHVMIMPQNHELVIKALPKIDDPVKFLSSINIKTKKTPLEMKREAEEVFFS